MRRTENISFQSSRMVRRTRLPQGGVKHLSVAVLVDNTVRFEGAGPKAKRIFESPSADQLKALHDLVAGVVGLSVERGDQVVIESQPFESTRNVQPPPLPPVLVKPAPGGGPGWLQNLMKNRVLFIGSIAGTLLFVVLMGGTVFMFWRKKKAQQVEIKGQIEGAAAPVVPVLDEATKKMEHQLAEQAAQRERQTAEALNALKLPPVTTKKGEVLTRHILDETKKDPKAVAQIMRTWINEAPSK
jgi:flagellar M-ring protein FliF